MCLTERVLTCNWDVISNTTYISNTQYYRTTPIRNCGAWTNLPACSQPDVRLSTIQSKLSIKFFNYCFAKAMKKVGFSVCDILI